MFTTRYSHQQASKPLLSLSAADDEQQEALEITTDPFMAVRNEKTQVRDKYSARSYGASPEELLLVNNLDLYKSRKCCRGINLTRFFDKMNLNLKTVGVGLFLLASLFCLYKIWVLTQARTSQPRAISNQLKMVNIFYRHGDRAASDRLLLDDPHRPLMEHLWPSGFGELTDLGRYREYRVGLWTRQRYDDYLGFNSSNIAAYSSSASRCIESMEFILRGLYENQWPKNRQRSILTERRPVRCTQLSNHTSGPDHGQPSCAMNLPEGSGFGDEWKRVKVDTETVAWLSHQALDSCKYRIGNPSPVDLNLTASADIRALVGVEQLRTVLDEKFHLRLNLTALSLWSTISSELNLVLTRSSLELKSHLVDLIGQVVSSRLKSILTLYDVLEQATLLAYRDRLQDESEYIQSGTLLTSVIESQLYALGRDEDSERWLWPAQRYSAKRMLLYASHDSIMQRILFSLSVIHMDPANFEQRFAKWYKSDDEWAKFLAGLKMSSFGMSFRVELWELTFGEQDETKSKPGRKTLPYVQVSLYNREDARFHEPDYKLVDIGTACMRLFVAKHGKGALDELSHFYDPELDGSLDKRQSCPFELWLNVTADLRVSRHRLQQLCPDSASVEAEREKEPTAAGSTKSASAKATNQLPDLVDRRK